MSKNPIGHIVTAALLLAALGVAWLSPLPEGRVRSGPRTGEMSSRSAG